MASRLAAEILAANMSKHPLRRGRRTIEAKTTKGKGENIARIGAEGPVGAGETLIAHKPSGGSTLTNA
jgi:hypothetical protein